MDNARESVDDKGQIIGIVASETLAARANQGISKVQTKNASLAGILEIAKGAVLSSSGPSGEIKYEPGVELKLEISRAADMERRSCRPCAEANPRQDESQ